MHVETKRTAIPIDVKQKVFERDRHCCILCGRPGLPNAHYIRRSQGGLGIEQNIVTLCQKCHSDYDNGFLRREYGKAIRDYLELHYPGFPDRKRIYSKYDWIRSRDET